MNRKKKPIASLFAAALAALTLFGCAPSPAQSAAPAAGPAANASVPVSAGQTVRREKMQVYFLDVGQGDCELIRLKSGRDVLIDSGTGKSAAQLTESLKKLGVSRIDFLVATHPHEDHIGGMEQVVRSFPVGKIYMPKIADAQVPTTDVYEKLLKAIQKKGLQIDTAHGGTEIYSDGDESMQIFAPNGTKYTDLNNYSVVIKLQCGEKSFLFTGDAEKESEQEMLKKGYPLKSDVLKCGHHGSSTSTSAAFLKAVAPKAAVISCGLNNDYGHPNAAVLSRLKKAGVTVYRTDRQGTVLAECDGKSIAFSTGLDSVLKK